MLTRSLARLEAKNAARLEEEEWPDLEAVEDWNPAHEAREAAREAERLERLESWRSSLEPGLGERNHKVTDSPSVFRPNQNPPTKAATM